MAIANQAPHVQAAEARRRDIDSRLSSPDSLTRYRAQEELFSIQAAQMGRAAVAEAEKNARRLDAQMRFYERSDRENCPYKPLPHNAKISKN